MTIYSPLVTQDEVGVPSVGVARRSHALVTRRINRLAEVSHGEPISWMIVSRRPYGSRLCTAGLLEIYGAPSD